jgi:hypothetical protein
MVSKFLDLQLYGKMEFHAHSSCSSRMVAKGGARLWGCGL